MGLIRPRKARQHRLSLRNARASTRPGDEMFAREPAPRLEAVNAVPGSRYALCDSYLRGAPPSRIASAAVEASDEPAKAVQQLACQSGEAETFGLIGIAFTSSRRGSVLPATSVFSRQHLVIMASTIWRILLLNVRRVAKTIGAA